MAACVQRALVGALVGACTRGNFEQGASCGFVAMLPFGTAGGFSSEASPNSAEHAHAAGQGFVVQRQMGVQVASESGATARGMSEDRLPA
jgi:hypothetical protein